MSEINDYCSVVNDTVDVVYHTAKIPILGIGIQDGSKYIDECSHENQCNVRTNDCPLFKKLNSI